MAAAQKPLLLASSTHASFQVFGKDLADLEAAVKVKLDALSGGATVQWTFSLRDVSPFVRSSRDEATPRQWEGTVDAETVVVGGDA